VIDVGSNALRLQVARVFSDGSFEVAHDEREPVRLGEEVFRAGSLSAEAIGRALETLSRYSAVARRFNAGRIRSVATSAVREAANGNFFLAEVQRTVGLDLEIISGNEEAVLIARGVLSNFDARSCRAALVDIGGGSAEISVVERGQVTFLSSLPLGSVRLTQMFCRSDPLRPEHERELRRHVRSELTASVDRRRVPRCSIVVGSAGTIGAVSNFIRRRPSAPRAIHRAGTSFTVRDLNRASAALRHMGLHARQQSPGIEEHRAEIIVAGAILLEEICHHLGATSIRVVRRGLRDGLMLEQVERYLGGR
jgi:exopolyphosphatase/guanosine-5'-triphosphate,3'-diphosphate pyrophosphatase